MSENLTSMKQSVKRSVKKSVDKAAALAPKKLQPMIKELPDRIVERADQVLLGLSHSKQSIPALLKQTLNRIEENPSDLVGRVSRSVLERAETVRKQLVEKAEDSETLLKTRWVPEWLKEASFVRSTSVATPAGEAADTIAAVQGDATDFDSSNIALAETETAKAAPKKKSNAKADASEAKAAKASPKSRSKK